MEYASKNVHLHQTQKEKEKLKSLKSFGQTKKEIKKDSESQLFSLIQVKILLK